MTRAAILISGGGTNLQAFIDATEAGSLDVEIAVVVSNRPEAYGLTRARNAGIPTECLRNEDYPDRAAFDTALAETLQRYRPDLLILAGFMRILSGAFVKRFEGMILNIHPALLPKYRGLNTHQRVIDAGEQWHGSTVHFVTEELDAGPRILQARVPVLADDTASRLSARVQAVEHKIYPQAAALFASGRLEFKDGASWLDGARLDEPVQYSEEAL
ncbi:MAG: phosphoribosylglycinamide formyltransferase [Woeseiaceae bacterium]